MADEQIEQPDLPPEEEAPAPLPAPAPAPEEERKPTNPDEKPELPLTPEDTKFRMGELGATIMFEKVLTSSDSSGSGRIVIPKSVAEANFPTIEAQTGMTLPLIDVFGYGYGFRYRYWINNASRMYLIEGTQELQQRFKLAVGDVLVFARKPDDPKIYVCGRKGTKDDTSRRAPSKRTAEGAARARKATRRAGSAAAAAAAAASEDGGHGSDYGDGRTDGTEDGGSPGEMPGDTAEGAVEKKVKLPAAAAATRSKRVQQRAQEEAETDLQHGTYTYWNGLSLPARRDGVFRAVPAAAGLQGSKVMAQHGYWTAVVSLGGEMYQAFFDSRDHAAAAYEAALQTPVVPPMQAGAAAGPPVVMSAPMGPM